VIDRHLLEQILKCFEPEFFIFSIFKAASFLIVSTVPVISSTMLTFHLLKL
jgi:hypothetical protein